jgi:PST family polysaccharide transporter
VTAPERHLASATAGPELNRRSVRSGLLQLLTQGAQIALFVGSGMVLARLLTPRDFGLVAMVSAVSTFFLTFRDFGFNLATAQREELNHEQTSALFWTHLRLTSASALIVAAMGPVLARFYGEPKLILIAPALALGIVLLGVGTLPEGVLIRQMRFPAVMAAELVATAVGVTSGIVAAASGAALWSLVLQFVVLGGVRSALVWRWCGWRPMRVRGMSPESRDGYRSLLGFGGRYTAARMLEYAGRNIDRVLVGYASGAGVLGLYDSAARWSNYPLLQLQGPLTRVAVVGLSRLQSDGSSFAAAARRGLTPVLALLVPMLAFMSVAARDVLLLLLGEQWIGAVPLFRVLCIGAIAVCVARSGTWIYLARGETRRQLRWALVQTPAIIVAVAIGTRWGAVGVAVAFATANWLLLYPGLAYCLATSPMRPRDYVAMLGRPLVASAVSVAVLLASHEALGGIDHRLTRLVLALGLFTTAYTVVWLATPGGRRTLGDVLRLTSALAPARG